MTVRFDLISVIGKLHMFVQINGIRVHFLCDKCLFLEYISACFRKSVGDIINFVCHSQQ